MPLLTLLHRVLKVGMLPSLFCCFPSQPWGLQQVMDIQAFSLLHVAVDEVACEGLVSVHWRETWI